MRFLIDENLPAAEQLFSQLNGENQQLRFFTGRATQPSELSDVDVLLVRSVTPVNEALIAHAPQLKLVGTATIGTDHIDAEALQKRNIAVANAAGCNAIAVGEYVLSAVLHIAAGQHISLADKPALVVGAGNTGQQAAQRLAALGMQVMFYDPPRQQQGDVLAFPFTDLADLQRFAVVTLHVPLILSGNHKTHHLFAAGELSQLADHAILINASRGPVVANDDLLQRLRSPKPLHVALDVWEHEPQVDKALVAAVALATPHIAGHSVEGKLRGTFQLYQAVHHYFGWQQPLFQLNDVLPPAETQIATLSARITQASLANLVQQGYAVAADDALFRQHGLTPEGFDALRKNYRLRQELSALPVTGAEAYKGCIQQLGFKWVENP